MSSVESLLRDVLREPSPAIEYVLSERLARAHPMRALLESGERVLDVAAFASAGRCSIEVRAEVHAQPDDHWQGPGELVTSSFRSAWLEVRWEGHALDVITLRYALESFGDQVRHYILADSDDVGRRFFAVACEWCNEVHGEVLVYANGCWNKSKSLREAVRSTTFEDLILPEALKSAIVRDFRSFVGAKEVYERLGIPWKRGVLLLGPPGNGKTQCIKAIVNDLGLACLYVQSFVAPHRPPQMQIAEVFRRARLTAPCLLVLEDLDSLIDAESRAFFLNELDGFAANRGIVTVASTNHPERLDPAIVDRPSRFDRKYHFELPAHDLRAVYLARWNQRVENELRVSDAALAKLASATEGFSFAYLKELFVSSMMTWVNDRTLTMEQLLDSIVELLRAQMASTALGEARDEHVSEDPFARQHRRGW